MVTASGAHAGPFNHCDHHCLATLERAVLCTGQEPNPAIAAEDEGQTVWIFAVAHGDGVNEIGDLDTLAVPLPMPRLLTP